MYRSGTYILLKDAGFLIRYCSPDHSDQSIKFVLQGKLVALGEESDGIKSLTLKAWDITLIHSGITPPTLATAKIFAASKLPEGRLLTSAVCTRDWPQATIVLGTSTGAVHIYKGDAEKGKLSSPFGSYVLRSARPSNTSPSDAPHQDSSRSITAVYINPGTIVSHNSSTNTTTSNSTLSHPTASILPHVFAVSGCSLVALSLSTGQTLMEDSCGAPRGCSALTSHGELLIIGTEAAFFYTAEEGRTSAIALKHNGHGTMVSFKSYIAMVLQEDASMVVRVFDLTNKVIAASALLPPPPHNQNTSADDRIESGNLSTPWIASSGDGAVLAVTLDPGSTGYTVLRLREKPLEERLQGMFRSRSFQAALRMARDENASPRIMADVHRRFGDFLYSKRDYDGAAEHYALTVGHIEPSYAIQKFLDAQKVNNLITYLEAVHYAVCHLFLCCSSL